MQHYSEIDYHEKDWICYDLDQLKLEHEQIKWLSEQTGEDPKSIENKFNFKGNKVERNHG